MGKIVYQTDESGQSNIVIQEVQQQVEGMEQGNSVLHEKVEAEAHAAAEAVATLQQHEQSAAATALQQQQSEAGALQEVATEAERQRELLGKVEGLAAAYRSKLGQMMPRYKAMQHLVEEMKQGNSELHEKAEAEAEQ